MNLLKEDSLYSVDKPLEFILVPKCPLFGDSTVNQIKSLCIKNSVLTPLMGRYPYFMCVLLFLCLFCSCMCLQVTFQVLGTGCSYTSKYDPPYSSSTFISGFGPLEKL